MRVTVSTSNGPKLPKNAVITRELFPLVCVALLALACSKETAEPLPVIAALPAPSLVDQDGRVFDGEAMRGTLWMTAFVFTHCRSTCPLLIAQMKKLQAKVRDVPNASFLTVSVDPRNDSPEVIKVYMRDNGIDETNWRFVTGSEKAIGDFVVGGFKVGYGKTQWSTELTHSNSFALVDDQARIRGYYGSDDQSIADLERDLRLLVDESAYR